MIPLVAVVTLAAIAAACCVSYKMGYDDAVENEQNIKRVKSSGHLIKGSPEWVRRQTTQVMP
jgi:hypothetical protein